MIVFLIGATCAGKSSLIEAVRQLPEYGVVEVGKALRAKYGPDYFKGQAAPEHTEREAWQTMLDGIDANEEKQITLIDGQPRSTQQAMKSMQLPYRKVYVHLWAPQLVRSSRSYDRDYDPRDPNDSKLRLSQARIVGDLPALYDVVSLLLINAQLIMNFNTNDECYSPLTVCHALNKAYNRSIL